MNSNDDYIKNSKAAGLTDNETRLLIMPFSALSAEETSIAFSASDRLAEYNRNQPHTPSQNLCIIDKDKLLKDGVVSPLDQKTYFTNRKAWGEHLKANGCVEIGNDYNNSTRKKREIKGDFDCRRELAHATQQVLG